MEWHREARELHCIVKALQRVATESLCSELSRKGKVRRGWARQGYVWNRLCGLWRLIDYV